MRKVSFLWVIVAAVAPVIAWGLTLIFGTGRWWESGRLNLDTVRTVLEIREKMNRTLEEIANTDPKNETLLKAKVEYFNAAEKSLARLERRSPVLYQIKPPFPTGVKVSMKLKVRLA